MVTDTMFKDTRGAEKLRAAAREGRESVEIDGQTHYLRVYEGIKGNTRISWWTKARRAGEIFGRVGNIGA